MRPICWLVRLKSPSRTGKSVDIIFPAAWTRTWVRTMMRRLELMRLLLLFATSSSILVHLESLLMRPLLPFMSC
jgi:hypothetical protein